MKKKLQKKKWNENNNKKFSVLEVVLSFSSFEWPPNIFDIPIAPTSPTSPNGNNVVPYPGLTSNELFNGFR